MKLQAGAATALHWAINSVRKGGIVSIVGVYGPTFNAVPIGNAMNKGLTLRMNQASVKRHLPRLIEHVQAGRINPSEIITHRVPLEEVTDAYHIFSAKLDNCIKTVLIPPRAGVGEVPIPLASAHLHRGDPPWPSTTDRSEILGWGADLDRANRPAVPMERTPPRLRGAHGTRPRSRR